MIISFDPVPASELNSYDNPRVLDRYTFYFGNRKVIAVTEANGREYRGVATCSPEDEYDEEFGKRLAFYRAELKVKRDAIRVAREDFNYYADRYQTLRNLARKASEEIDFNQHLYNKVTKEMENLLSK